MKKFAVLISAAVFMLSGCSGNESSLSEEDTLTQTETVSEILTAEESASASDTENNGESNILIAYFSRVGNTDFEADVDAVTSASINIDNGAFAGNAEILAGYVNDITGGDTFLIETVEKYPSDYRETTDMAADEQKAEARPELASSVENFEDYDTVVLIYPNWWGTIPMPVATFLESYDFTGKTILPICTHEGSAMGSSESKIAEILPDVNIKSGLSVRGGSVKNARSEVEEYIKSNLG